MIPYLKKKPTDFQLPLKISEDLPATPGHTRTHTHTHTHTGPMATAGWGRADKESFF